MKSEYLSKNVNLSKPAAVAYGTATTFRWQWLAAPRSAAMHVVNLVWRRLMSMSRRCQEDVKKMSRRCQEDVKKMSRRCQEDVKKMSRRCQCMKDVSWVSRVSCVSDDPWHAYHDNITEQKICVDLSVALCMKTMKINEAVRCWDPRWTGIRRGAVTLWEKGIGPDRDAGLDMRYTNSQNCWKPLLQKHFGERCARKTVKW